MANTYLTYQGFNVLKNAAKDLTDEMVKVEYSMVEIDRVLDENTLNINDYRDRLIKLAYDYGNSFDNVADATLRLAQAGFSSEEALALTEKTLLALNTAELDATQATDGLVAIMSQWGLMTGDAAEEAEEYGKIIDYINRTADNFPTTSANILDALKRSSSAFKANGATIEETIATIVAAEKATQRGGKVIGTAMNSIVQQLRDTGKLATMEALGLDVYADSAKTEFKSVMDILGELADKMNELTAAGKSNSVEFQQLNSIFSLYRRNITSSLFGEMDEGGTYDQVLKLLEASDTIGYSMRENSKHMNTAKAALAQFNATLLELKTAIWDGGAKDVFKGLLVLGTDLAKALTILIKTFGAVPTTIAILVLALTSLKKSLQAVNLETDQTSGAITEMISHTKLATSVVGKLSAAYKAGEISANTLRVATVALNFAFSALYSAGIMLVLKVLSELVNSQNKVIEKEKELARQNAEVTQQLQTEEEAIGRLIDRYEDLGNLNLTSEDREELRKIEQEIEKITGGEVENLDLINGNYEEQLNILREIKKEKLESEAQSLSQDLENTDELIELRVKETQLINEKAKLEEKIAKVQHSVDAEARHSAEKYNITLNSVNKALEENRQKQEEIREGINFSEVNEKLAESMAISLAENIKSLDDYKQALDSLKDIPLMENFKGSLEEQQRLIQNYLQNEFPQFEDSLNTVGYYSEYVANNFTSLATEIENLSSQFDMVSKAADEFNSSGAITASTFKNLAKNDLIQYLDVVNGKMVINKDYFEKSAEAARLKAIADLQERAAIEILNIVTADLNGTLQETKAAGETAAIGVKTTSAEVIDAANTFLKGKVAADEFNASLNKLAGKNIGNISGLSDNAKKQIGSITTELQKEIRMINSLAGSVTKASSAGAAGSRAATKTFEEQSAERVKIFKKEIDELESLEKSWVNKYKKLELFSTNDLKFITHQRINRYNEYLNQINQLTGISEEDRADLIREYSSKRQEAELEYFDLLKKQLEDRISDLEKANKERIQQIKDEAQAQIDALEEVEDVNDRIRQKEEYEAKRNELLYGYQGVEYWRQRTGRDAQLALQDAEQKLKELDDDWEQKKKDWTLEEQIEQIEEARDAQIKAIEDAQEQQIQGWKNAYNQQVQLYAQTGQIIYDDSVISAGYLYNAYMDNFVNPLNLQLQNVISSLGTASAQASNVINQMNAISRGGGSTSDISITASNALMAGATAASKNINIGQAVRSAAQIAATSISAKNPLNASSVLNRLKTGATNFVKSLKVFHGGGEVGGTREGVSILRPNEMVLNPEWTSGMKKFLADYSQGRIGSNISGGTSIEVQGNLVNIDAKIKNKQDADYLTEQIEKTLKDKFNIKK